MERKRYRVRKCSGEDKKLLFYFDRDTLNGIISNCVLDGSFTFFVNYSHKDLPQKWEYIYFSIILGDLILISPNLQYHIVQDVVIN